MTSRFRPRFLVSAAAVVGALGLATGCSALLQYDDLPGEGGAGGAGPCTGTEPAGCDDSNACTVDSCDVATGACRHEPVDGTPAPTQVPGDCLVILCSRGTEQLALDADDVPSDENDCTEDLCVSGEPSNPPLPVGTTCSQNGGTLCDGAETDPACVQCFTPSDCSALPGDDECQTRQCEASVCTLAFTEPGTPVAAQTDGDCQRTVCDGAGAMQATPDDEDVPNDANVCTQDVCTAGTPSNPFAPEGTPCPAGSCNATGQCTGCTTAADCGVSGLCLSWSCDGDGVCGQNLVSAGTPLPSQSQVAGDCKQRQCNGSGGEQTAVDDQDVPADDGSACTEELCSNGSPQHRPLASGTSCSQNGGTVCNGTGVCVRSNGAACAVDGECLSTYCVDDVCCSTSCAATCRTCDSSVIGPGICASYTPFTDPEEECDGDLVCGGADNCIACGYIPTSSADTCPAVCTGGCDLVEGICSISCPENGPCDHGTIGCPSGMSCEIHCTGKEACRYTVVKCAPGGACRVGCDAESTCRDLTLECAPFGACSIACSSKPGSCNGANVLCGANSCEAQCLGYSEPQMHCGSACRCTPCP